MNQYIPIAQEHVGNNAQLVLEELVDRAGTLTLTLVAVDGQRIRVTFDSYMAYRKLDEGDALRILSAISHSGGAGKYLYRVDDSDFIAWFNAERCGELPKVVHYSIGSIDDIVDVLSLDPPTIEPEAKNERGQGGDQ